jgi:hypothetical protein
MVSHVAGDIRVFAPVQQVAEVDGVSLLLLTVEILDDFTALRFYCPRNEFTRALDDEHEQAMQDWIERHRRGEKVVAPPDSPMHVMFAGDRFPSIVLDDGRGTDFGFQSGQFGSPGEWLLDAIFRGTPAPTARTLTVSMTTPAGATTPVQVVLQD